MKFSLPMDAAFEEGALPLGCIHCPRCTAPARRKPSRGLLLDGDFSAFLGLEKIPQPDNFKNMYR
jgi:hypothetical protein